MLVEGGKILLEGVHRVSMKASQGGRRGLGYGTVKKEGWAQ